MAPSLVHQNWGEGFGIEPRAKTTPNESAVRKELIQELSQSISRYEAHTDAETDLWLNPELKEDESTANLDNQQPATLYYLGLLINIPKVQEVYVEELEKGKRKHWAVLAERDYDIMDRIYDIEEDTLDRFPHADLSFRVTVASSQGPTISPKATKIFNKP